MTHTGSQHGTNDTLPKVHNLDTFAMLWFTLDTYSHGGGELAKFAIEKKQKTSWDDSYYLV